MSPLLAFYADYGKKGTVEKHGHREKKGEAQDHLRRIKNTGCKASHNDGSRFVTTSAQKACKHGFQVVNQEVKSYYYKTRSLDETTRIDLLSWQNCLPLLMSA